MKLTFIIDKLINAGTQRHLFFLAESLHRMNHKVSIICLEEKGPLALELEEQGISVEAFHTGPIYSLGSIIRFWGLVLLLRRSKPDIVQTFLFKANIMGAFASRLAGIPLVFTSRRSMGYDFKPSHYKILRIVEALSSGITVNSRAIKRATCIREKQPAHRIHLIYNGVKDHVRDVTIKRQLKNRLSLPQTSLIIGVVANVRPVKGYETFIRAMKVIYQYYPKLYVLIIGDTSGNREYYQNLLKLMGREMLPRVRFMNGVSNPQHLLDAVDIAVLPSNSEGFSNTLLEYMAAGKPIVSTGVGGNAEAVTHQETGLLVSPKEPAAMAKEIVRLIEDPCFARSLGKAAQKRALQQFSLDTMTNGYMELYHQALAGSLKQKHNTVTKQLRRGLS